MLRGKISHDSSPINHKILILYVECVAPCCTINTNQTEWEKALKPIYFHPSFNVTDSFIAVSTTVLLSALWKWNVTCYIWIWKVLLSVCMNEAIEGIITVLLVKVKFTFYFIVFHGSNLTTHCQNIYTIETKQVFTRVRYEKQLFSSLLCVCELPLYYTRKYSIHQG